MSSSRTTRLDGGDADVRARSGWRPAPSDSKLVELVLDLTRVGPRKPMGHLPVDTITLGSTPWLFREESLHGAKDLPRLAQLPLRPLVRTALAQALQRGQVVRFAPPRADSLGAVYVIDMAALKVLLASRAREAEQVGLPSDPDAFARLLVDTWFDDERTWPIISAAYGSGNF